MADPIRLRIQKAICTALEAISPADGYVTDLTVDATHPRRAFRGRVLFGDEDPIPMVSVLEVPVPLEMLELQTTNTIAPGEWELIVQGWCKDDKTDPTDPAQFMLVDVKRALALEKLRDNGQNILGLGNAVYDLQFGSGVVRPPDEISSKAYFWLNLKVKMVENWCDPFAG